MVWKQILFTVRLDDRKTQCYAVAGMTTPKKETPVDDVVRMRKISVQKSYQEHMI
jgi:hypothetical protein